MGGCAARFGPVSEVAIIVLSVRDGEKDKIAALDAGADDYPDQAFQCQRTAGADTRQLTAHGAIRPERGRLLYRIPSLSISVPAR